MQIDKIVTKFARHLAFSLCLSFTKHKQDKVACKWLNLKKEIADKMNTT